MKRFTFFLLAGATMAGLFALTAPVPGHADAEPSPIFVTEIPHGYRDWQWISSAPSSFGHNHRSRQLSLLVCPSERNPA